jgi:hypothetical protein
MPVIANGTTSFSETSKRSYIATGVFTTYFYSYTSSKNANNQFVYTLSQNASATDAQCKAGHILKENGRKVVFGVNNIDTNTTTTLNTSGNRPYYLVGVFDSSSMLSGFIDPNSPLFAPYSTDLPNFYDRSSSTVTGPDGTTNDMGPPVFTSGTVTAAGQIRSTTKTTLGTTSPIALDGSLGQVYTLAQPNGLAMTINAANVPAVGSLVYIVITPAGTGALISWGTNIKGLNVTPATGKVTTCAFISDGTNLNQFGAITST